MEKAKQTFQPGVSLFHEPSDALLAHVLNVFGTYYICTGKIFRAAAQQSLNWVRVEKQMKIYSWVHQQRLN